MKKIAQVTALSLAFLLASCGQNDKEENTQAAERHQTSAQTYQRQGQLRAAMLEAKNAIQLTPDAPGPYITLAKILNQTGAFASTISLLEPRVEAMPAVATELAEAHYAIKKYRTALNIIETHPADAAASEMRQQQLFLAAMANIALGEKDGQQQAISQFREQGGSEADVLYLQANAELGQGQTEAAITLLESAIQKNENHLKALTLLGSLTAYNNQLQVAEQHYTKALGLLPTTDVITIDRAKVLSQLTDVLIQQGRTSEAYVYQKLLAEANPERNEAQQKFTDAMEYYQQGKLIDAEKLLKELREQFPDDKNTATLLGMIEFQQGADKSAIDLFDQFVDPETATPTVIQAAALAKFRTNQVDDAVKLLKDAAQSQPNNAAILATYGLALLDRDPTSSEGALTLEKSLALDPTQQRLRIMLAKRYTSLEQPEQALAQLQKAYEASPMDLLVEETYLKLLMERGDEEQAKAVINDLQQKYPDSPRPAFLNGWFSLTKKEYAEAEKHFEKALSMRNNNEKSLSYAGLAQLYSDQNQPLKAINAWQSLLEADPKNINAYKPWLALMTKQQKLKDADEFLRALAAKSEEWQPSAVLAQLLFVTKQSEAAMPYIEKALEKSRNADNVKTLAANIYHAYSAELRAANKLEDAKTWAAKAVALIPDNLMYLSGLIESELAGKNTQEAQKLLDQFPQSEGSQAGKAFLQGRIRMAEGKPDEALQEYLKSWSLEPNEMVAETIYVYYSQTKNEARSSFAAEWKEKLPKSRKANLILAMDAQLSDDLPTAIKLYEEIIQQEPSAPAVLNNLAWNYYLAKDPRALETARKAYELAPAVPAILDTYGWILVEHGKVSEGLEYLERAAAGDKENGEIQQHLQEARTRLKQQ